MSVITVASGNQLCAIDTEHSLAQITGVGVYVLEVDKSVLADGDTVTIVIKNTCLPAEIVKSVYSETFSGVQSLANWHSIPLPIASGNQIVCTINQSDGEPKSFTWNLMRM